MGRQGRGFHPNRRGFARPTTTARFTLSGVVKDEDGAVVVGASVHLYESATDVLVAVTTSVAGGVYAFDYGNNAGFFYARAYRAGSPDLFGTTLETLVLS